MDYDNWVIAESNWKGAYSWCQFCKHNKDHYCNLQNKKVDDDCCCNDCDIDTNKVNALSNEETYF